MKQSIISHTNTCSGKSFLGVLYWIYNPAVLVLGGIDQYSTAVFLRKISRYNYIHTYYSDNSILHYTNVNNFGKQHCHPQRFFHLFPA